jgi:hypothetical protein
VEVATIQIPSTAPNQPPTIVSWDVLAIAGFSVITTASYGLIRWFLGRSVSQIDERLEKADQDRATFRESLKFMKDDFDERFSDFTKEMGELKNLTHKYVPQDDYVRNAAVFEGKVDALHRRMDEIFLILTRSKGA